MDHPRDIWMLGISILVWVGGKDYHMALSDRQKAKKMVDALGLPGEDVLSKVCHRYGPNVNSTCHCCVRSFCRLGDQLLYAFAVSYCLDRKYSTSQ